MEGADATSVKSLVIRARAVALHSLYCSRSTSMYTIGAAFRHVQSTLTVRAVR